MIERLIRRPPASLIPRQFLNDSLMNLWVGIVEIVGEGYPDPTSDDPQWVVVDVAPVVPFTKPVSLATIKSDPKLPEIQLVKRGRLSVVPLTSQEFRHVARLGKTPVPKLSESRAQPSSGKKAGKG